MNEILYTEVPTPEIATVRRWLQDTFQPAIGRKESTPDGIRIVFDPPSGTQPSVSLQAVTPTPRPVLDGLPPAISVFVWSVQRTTYLKAFRWVDQALPGEDSLVVTLKVALEQQFPPTYPAPPQIDLAKQSIFAALEDIYPQTVRYFQRMPNGEADLTRAYWWEQRWRESVRNPQHPQQVIFRKSGSIQEPDLVDGADSVDLIYVGGALGVIHAAVMARLGYRVLLIERLPFGRMNREWNISRQEFQHLIDLGLFTAEEFEGLIAREYEDGFNKFFDANNPAIAQSPVLHTPTVLNICLDSEKLLRLCGDKLLAAGGLIWDETDFVSADIYCDGVQVITQHRSTGDQRRAVGRLLVDAMGTASPIAWQLNGGRTFDSVCPTVGACISGGFPEGVWDSKYGDVLFSHGDVSRGRQLIWELFPGQDEELTVYLFHYHQVHPDNPGSLLEMYEDFFTILPEYRRCDLDKLTWRKATFGYIPGHFSVRSRDRKVAIDRLIAIGDAASLQSPLVFTGFGSLVRNLSRLTDLLHTALQHDLLESHHLEQIRAFQSNVAVTWLFSKGMMVPTGEQVPPARINSMLNTFFGVLEQESPEVADRFIKDRCTWWEFNRMALVAALRNPALLLWIWELAGLRDLIRWLGSYATFTWRAFLSWLLSGLLLWVNRTQTWIEAVNPALWFWLKAQTYDLTYGVGQPPPLRSSGARPEPPKSSAGLVVPPKPQA